MSKWIKNISFSLWGKILAMLFLVLLDISAARILNVDGYAEWVYFFSILTMLFYIGWGGINTATKVFISKCVDICDEVITVVASFVLRLVVSIVIVTIIVIIMPRMAIYLGYPQKYPDLKWLLGFSGILVFLNSFTEYFKELFIGKNAFKSVFIFTVVEYGGYFFFSILGLKIQDTLKFIACGYAISGMVIFICGIKVIYSLYRGKIHCISSEVKTKLSLIYKYALPMALISLGGLILVEMDTFMLGLMSTKEDVAVYSIAKNLCQKATHVNYALTVGVMTSFAVVSAENYKDKKKDFKKATMMNLAITLVIVVSFLVFADTAINILYGTTYSRAAVLLRCLTVYYALYGISNFFSSFLDFRGRAGARSILYLSVVIINFVLNFAWIPRYGANGAAFATALSLVPYTVLVSIMSYMEWEKYKLE